MRISARPWRRAAYNPAVHRFYAPAFEAADQTIALPEEEAQHLVRVLRVEKGREVLVFNGRGHQCRARVELADKRGVVLRVTGVELPAPELPFELTLAQAAFKGDKTDDVVRDAVMLGVSCRAAARHPVHRRASRTTRGGPARGAVAARGRELGQAVRAGGRAGRARARHARIRARGGQRPEARARGAGRRRHRCAQSLDDVARPEAATVFVGPEGGWAPEEVSRAREAGAMLVNLGARTLRADAVPVVALSILLYAWEAL